MPRTAHAAPVRCTVDPPGPGVPAGAGRGRRSGPGSLPSARHAGVGSHHSGLYLSTLAASTIVPTGLRSLVTSIVVSPTGCLRAALIAISVAALASVAGRITVSPNCLPALIASAPTFEPPAPTTMTLFL